jgi:tetratricopeptide (TPR) repeat protein
MRARFFPFIFLLVMLVHGCATPGKESFKIGLELEKQNRLEESLSMFDDAVAKERRNDEYAAAADRVRHRLIEALTARANSFLDTRPLTFEQLQQALTHAEKALKLDGNNADSVKLVEDTKRQLNDMIARAEVLNTAAVMAVDAKEWKYALDQLRQVGEFYPSYPELKEKEAKTENDAVAYYLREADVARRNDDLATAITMLAQALSIKPADQNVAKMLADARVEHSPEKYLAKAQALVQQNDWKRIVVLLEKAKKLNPAPEVRSRIEKLSSEAFAVFIERAMHDTMEGNLYGAFGNLVSSGYTAGKKYDDRTDQFAEKLATALMEKAGGYENSGKLGNALVWYEKARKITGEQRDLFLKIESLREKIKQRVVKKIAVMDFTPPSASPDAGRVMTDNLLSYLTKNASTDVKIFARDVLGAILKEIELGQAGLYDIESAKKAGKLKGTDVLIFGSVLQYNVEKSIDEGLKMVNAVVGKKTILNPAHQFWVASHRDPSDEEKRMAPPQFIEEDMKEIVKYRVATHKKTANVSVSFRVIDVEEGEVIVTKTLKNKKEAVDTYSEGVEFANIPFKELKLPTDGELLDHVVEETISELGYGVLSLFQNLQVTYANSAEMMRKKGDYEQSIERCVDAAYVEELKNVSTPIAENARREIETLLQTIAAEQKTVEKPRIAGGFNREVAKDMSPGGVNSTGGNVGGATSVVPQPETDGKSVPPSPKVDSAVQTLPSAGRQDEGRNARHASPQLITAGKAD